MIEIDWNKVADLSRIKHFTRSELLERAGASGLKILAPQHIVAIALLLGCDIDDITKERGTQ